MKMRFHAIFAYGVPTVRKARSFMILTWVCGSGVIGGFFPVACRAATPTVLASGLNSPANIMVDGTNVYWTEQPQAGDAGFPRQIGSVSKTSGGGAPINYNYTGDPVYANAGVLSGGSDFVLDDGFIYYIGRGFDGTYYYPAVCKVPKAGGASIALSPGQVDPATLAIGPAGGSLYYGSRHQAPNDKDDTFDAVVALGSLGGGETVLTYSGYNWGAGGNYTINGTTWYYGLAALEYDKSQNTNFSYCFTRTLGSSCTDGANLYWADGSAIWSMPLAGGDPAALFTGSNHIYAIAAPTSGAASGSLFWVEASGGSASLRRRDPAGQVTLLIGPTSSMFFYYRCFAVSGNQVYCGAAGGLVEVSIDGGLVSVLAGPDYPFGPVSVATDDASIYWTGNGQILRLARPGVVAGSPTLKTSQAGNSVTLSWPDASGWSLKQNSNLSATAGWSPSGGITNSHGTNYLKILSPTGNLFFRLSNP